MIKEVVVINSTAVGICQTSLSGNMIVDAGFDAHLVKHLKKQLTGIKVVEGDVDDLEQRANRLFLISDRVAAAIDHKSQPNVLIYSTMDGILNKNIDKLAQRIASYLQRGNTG